MQKALSRACFRISQPAWRHYPAAASAWAPVAVVWGGMALHGAVCVFPGVMALRYLYKYMLLIIIICSGYQMVFLILSGEFGIKCMEQAVIQSMAE